MKPAENETTAEYKRRLLKELAIIKREIQTIWDLYKVDAASLRERQFAIEKELREINHPPARDWKTSDEINEQLKEAEKTGGKWRYKKAIQAAKDIEGLYGWGPDPGGQ